MSRWLENVEFETKEGRMGPIVVVVETTSGGDTWRPAQYYAEGVVQPSEHGMLVDLGQGIALSPQDCQRMASYAQGLLDSVRSSSIEAAPPR